MADPVPFDTERDEAESQLVVDVGGFEGPLDLLLDLARRQKVDLREISVLALAEQYLAFIEAARGLRLDLAADYLVMAAWLAYLKSRLLLPEPPKADAPSAGDLAERLATRLRRLEAMRAAAEILFERPRLGRDVFARGVGDPVPDGAPPRYSADLYDLLAAYARQTKRRARSDIRVTVARRAVWSMAQAREALERLVGGTGDWIAIDAFLLRYLETPQQRATALASMLAATLEMVREGKAMLRQEAAFAPLLVRRRDAGTEPVLA